MAECHCLLFEPVLLQCISVLTTIRCTETRTHACADYTGMLLCSTGAFKVLNYAMPRMWQSQLYTALLICSEVNPFQLFTALLIYSGLLQSSPLPSGSPFTWSPLRRVRSVLLGAHQDAVRSVLFSDGHLHSPYLLRCHGMVHMYNCGQQTSH